jgi:hypothetical protein
MACQVKRLCMLVSGGEQRGGGVREGEEDIKGKKGIGLKTWERGEEREVEGGTRGRRWWLQSDFKHVEKC